MTYKTIILILASVGVTAPVVWALLSIITAAFSFVYRAVSLSFRLYTTEPISGSVEYHELPVLTALCILIGAALLIFGISSIPSAD